MVVLENLWSLGYAVQILDRIMEIKKVTISDYRNLAQTNDYFLWSFLQREQNIGDLTIWSVFDSKVNPKNGETNKLIDFLKIFPISFYESYADESFDFLHGLGINHNSLYKVITDINIRWTHKNNIFYNPVIVLFKKYRMIDSTYNHCYCIEGITEMIINNAPELASKFKID